MATRFGLQELFGPERCPKCHEALTPKTLKKRGGYATIQCKCDSPKTFKKVKHVA